MEKALVTKRSEYTEICAFRRAEKMKDETVNEYAMRLRVLAKHCNYGTQMEKEIERQFRVSCGMVEVEKECVRTDNLDLQKVLVMASGYERSASNMKVLRQRAEFTNQINYTTSRDWKNGRANEEPGKAGGNGGHSKMMRTEKPLDVSIQ